MMLLSLCINDNAYIYSYRTTGSSAVNEHDLNQPMANDTYSREYGGEHSSHDYASIHLQGVNITNTADLEKGGRYTRVANQIQINNYAEINNPTPTNEQVMEIIPQAGRTHGYDVPKPQNRALQPPSSATWGPAQSYERPEEVIGTKKSKTKQPSNRDSRDDDVDDEYVQPHLLRRPCDAADIMPVYSNRKVSNESTSLSNVPQPRERHSPGTGMSTHGSGDRLEILPQKHQLPSYENIDKDGFIIGQAPAAILSAAQKNPVDSGVAKPKPMIPVKVELKKPAIPSKLFKPTAELKQI